MSQLQVATLNADRGSENSGVIEDDRPIEGGEVVGYIQGYGPVTADPNISAAVIKGIHILMHTVPWLVFWSAININDNPVSFY